METSGWTIVFVGAGILTSTIAALLILRGKKPEYKLQEKNDSSQGLMTLGSSLVVLGIVFGASPDRLIGYSFIGTGVVLSILGAIKARRNEQRASTEMR